MRNEKLIQAREQRNWTQEDVAEEIGITRTAYARWEEKGVIPRPWAIKQACAVFKMSPEQLGFKKYASEVSTLAGGKHLVLPSSLPVPSANGVGTASDMLSIGISALMLYRHTHECTLEELLFKVEQEMRRMDMTQKGIPRREMLHFLSALPLAFLGLTQGGSNQSLSLPAEETLPLYVTAIPACWRLYFDGGIAEVEQVLPSYISQLSILAQQPSQYQKLAASVSSQAYQLSWLLALQHQDFGLALDAIKQAFYYGDIAGQDNLRLASLVRQAHIFFHLRRPIQQLQVHQKALQFNGDATPLLQGWLYVTLAESQAQLGYKDDAQNSLSIARDIFPDHPEDDPNFSYVPVDHFFFADHEAITQMHLDQSKHAWETLERIDKVVPVSVVPRRVELQCRQAEALFKLGEMDQCCAYVELAGTSALKLGSDLRYNEASETYQQMQLKWPHERKVKALSDLFQG
jgi:transcriptional regulator with XRE-family HTH domain